MQTIYVHLYKLSKYDAAFKLSWKVVRLRHKIYTNSSVHSLVMPEFLQIMDEDIVPIVAVAVLVLGRCIGFNCKFSQSDSFND